MRIINQQTKAEFDKIAAISFKIDGVNIKGTIQVQGNQIPPAGVYLMPDLNGVLISVKNNPLTEHEWLEFDVVIDSSSTRNTHAVEV